MSTTSTAMKITIDTDKCIRCGLCREVCPEDAVHPKLHSIHHHFEVIADECTGCGECLSYCAASGALVQYEVA